MEQRYEAVFPAVCIQDGDDEGTPSAEDVGTSPWNEAAHAAWRAHDGGATSAATITGAAASTSYVNEFMSL